jgi:hypothetical protein
MELLYDGFRFLNENLNDASITRDDMKAKIRQGGHRLQVGVAAWCLRRRAT